MHRFTHSFARYLFPGPPTPSQPPQGLPAPSSTTSPGDTRPPIWPAIVAHVASQLLSARALRCCTDTAGLRGMARAYARLAVLNQASWQALQPTLSMLRAADNEALAFSQLLRGLDESVARFRAGRDDWQASRPRSFIAKKGIGRALSTASPVPRATPSPPRHASWRTERYVAQLVRRLARLYADPTLGVKAAERVLMDVLKALKQAWPKTSPTTLLDNDKLFLSFAAVVFRDWWYEPFTYEAFEPNHGRPPSWLLSDLSLAPDVLPPRERALLAIDHAIVRLHGGGFQPDAALNATHELSQWVGGHPTLETHLLDLEDAVAFLTGQTASSPLLDRLIEHLLREGAHWGAADITLLQHLAVLGAIDGATLAHGHTDIGSLDPAWDLHVDAMNHLARFQREHALRGTGLQPAQRRGIENALVRFMRHLCELVSEHEAAGAWKHLELMPQALLVSAFLRLDVPEQVKIAASCPEWPDLTAVLRELPVPADVRRAMVQHVSRCWPQSLGLMFFSRLGRWHAWLDSVGAAPTADPH